MIINILKFDKDEDRVGAACDASNLTHLFLDLGYQPLYYTDQRESITSEKFNNVINEFKDVCLRKNVSSLVVYLGSHGTEGYLNISKGEPINYYKRVIGKLCDPKKTDSHSNWSAIPKLFFIQACRTPPADGEGAGIENALVCFACSVGQAAYRDPRFGSYFVQNLTNTFRFEAHSIDLIGMLTKVCL